MRESETTKGECILMQMSFTRAHGRRPNPPYSSDQQSLVSLENEMFGASLVEFLSAPPSSIFNDFVKLFWSLHDAKFEFWGTSL